MEILKVRFRTNEEFDEHYQRDLTSGGLFCPTTTPLEDGQAVVIELSVPALPNKVLIRGVVRSWRPALPRLRVRAGAVVEFMPEEEPKRKFVLETLAGTRGPSPRRKHTRLPVDIEVRYRLTDDASFSRTRLTEISVGGAMLSTTEPLPLDADVILEITPPGAVSAIAISGKVAYHGPTGGTGLKFVYRDGGGSRRLRELIRRLRQS
ncbi:MAG: PilZ domain-containing protein [Proteobacteria bacterium]|nr:PilZ domain-containing protein [Pseudomonadota bacterium]